MTARLSPPADNGNRKNRPAPAVLRLLVEEARRDVAVVVERRPASADAAAVLASPVRGKRSYGLRDDVRLLSAAAAMNAEAGVVAMSGEEALEEAAAAAERLLTPMILQVPQLQGGGRIGSGSSSSGTASLTPRNDVLRCGSLASTPPRSARATTDTSVVASSSSAAAAMVVVVVQEQEDGAWGDVGNEMGRGCSLRSRDDDEQQQQTFLFDHVAGRGP